MMTAETKELMVRKSVEIDAPVEHVFDVFVNKHDLWWPRSHHIGKTEQFVAKLEPKAGGRWFEVGSDGSECNWGRVLEWQPNKRIVLTWDISAEWQYDPNLANEVEVNFVALGPERTRVELEHRKIERYGVKAQEMAAVFDSERGWAAILGGLAKVATIA